MNRWLGSDRPGAEEYDRRFAEGERAGRDMHGEATFVESLRPKSVLDAGCGTGRVAKELARRGITAVGVDLDASMLAGARAKGPELEWHLGDLTTVDLTTSAGAGPSRRLFDVVVMAGNVMIFLEPGREAAVVANLARHLTPGGALVAGFQLDGRLSVADYDRMCVAAGLELVERWATWDRQPWREGGDYAVSVHRAARPAGHLGTGPAVHWSR